MITKRQFLMIVSVAVAFFLLGSMFIGGLIAMGNGDGNPWERVWTAITGLKSRVETLEEQSLPQGFITAPAYDSGWVDIDPGFHYFEHNLGTTEVFVYLQGCYWWDGVPSIENHGEFEWQWLNTTHIHVNPGVNVDQIRVMIWKISEPT